MTAVETLRRSTAGNEQRKVLAEMDSNYQEKTW